MENWVLLSSPYRFGWKVRDEAFVRREDYCVLVHHSLYRGGHLNLSTFLEEPATSSFRVNDKLAYPLHSSVLKNESTDSNKIWYVYCKVHCVTPSVSSSLPVRTQIPGKIGFNLTNVWRQFFTARRLGERTSSSEPQVCNTLSKLNNTWRYLVGLGVAEDTEGECKECLSCSFLLDRCCSSKYL
jgi:hypothetical protein